MLQVNNNGLLAFEQEIKPNYRPQTLPLEGNHANASIIAPYWADIDIQRVGGNITHRQTNNTELLQKASRDARNYFFLEQDFDWMFIATWHDVGFYGASGDGKKKVIDNNKNKM